MRHCTFHGVFRDTRPHNDTVCLILNFLKRIFLTLIRGFVFYTNRVCSYGRWTLHTVFSLPEPMLAAVARHCCGYGSVFGVLQLLQQKPGGVLLRLLDHIHSQNRTDTQVSQFGYVKLTRTASISLQYILIN